jgi:spermidine/putrescine transport system permease protein
VLRSASTGVRGQRFSSLRTPVERLLALPPLAWLGFFFVGPLAIIVVYAFAHAIFGGVVLGFTIVNFREALSGFYLSIFFRTLQFAALGTGLCLLVAMPVAYFLARKVTRYRALFVVLLIIPFWTSFLIRTLAWRTLLAADGPIRDALNFLGLHHGLLYVLDTTTAVKIGIVYGYLPLMAIPLLVAFERIPEEVSEASKDLGAGRLRTFFSVTLPLARPGLATGVLLTFVPMTGEYVIPALLGGDRGVLMSGLIATQYLQAQNYPLGSAMAVLVLAIVGASVFLLARMTRGFTEVAQ